MNIQLDKPSVFISARGELRVILLYVPAVIVYGLLANVGMPVLEVIWDMVFYKALAFSLYHWSTFDLSQNQPVPPLYSAILSLGFFAKDYLTVEMVQSWINPAMYFLGLFPMYWLARNFTSTNSSLFACLVYVFYPAVVYTQWSMSENLSAPLTLCVFWAALELLKAEKPRWGVALGLAIVMAALCLTRIQALLLCGFVGLWLPFRCWRTNKPFAPPLVGAILSGALVIAVWGWLGFLSVQQNSPFYFNLERPESSALSEIASNFLTYLAAHGAALWIEGGLILTSVLLGAWLVAILAPSSLTTIEREYALLIGWALLLVVGFVSLYYILRAPYENWSIGLRYIFYFNHAAVPLAVALVSRFHRIESDHTLPEGGWKLLVAAVSISMLIAAGTLWTGVWPALSSHKAFFTNAPSLDFLAQLRSQGPIVGGGVLAAISCILLVLWFSTWRPGMIAFAIILLYIQFATVEAAIGIRKAAAETLWGEAIHYFCDDYQNNKWRNLPIYCHEEFPFLVPNLNYWIQAKVFAVPDDRAVMPDSYVLVTPNDWPTGELVFSHQGLKAFLIEPK